MSHFQGKPLHPKRDPENYPTGSKGDPDRIRRLLLYNHLGYWPQVIANEYWGIRYNHH